ncbi:SGNH/GDSL hydrolase family protein [Loigolactobacillus zhaoyuanensis]|uniref:SGNH/GDSL hydrolase family protein n=1 Tax=Loigolactobacillus zhaoyuanensis TaxID=2486017 RepID=UPI001CDCE2ED|nr:SGNH/GDSL hydrolase family protein [Loigolactobacillus zhaoyuanensis]
MRGLKILKEIVLVVVIIGVIAGGIYAGLNYFAPGTASDQVTNTRPKPTVKKKKTIQLVAVGDSLTEGIGDGQKQGGYVGIIKDELTTKQTVKTQTQNYGIAGETSTQIDQRVKTDRSLQQALKKADVITMSVGGNDLMAVLRQQMLNLNEADIKKAQTAYLGHLTTLLQDVRQQNTTAPIFVFGIYNPFYLYFPKMTKMQTAVEDWNSASAKIIKQQKNSYLIDICDQLSKGEKLTTQKKTTAKATSDSSSDKNSLIFTEDNFHPNHSGYQVMADDLYQVMMQQKNKWLYR